MRIDRDHALLAASALVSLALMSVFDRDGPDAWLERHDAAAAAHERQASQAPAATPPARSAESPRANGSSPAVDPSRRALRTAEVERLAAHVADKWHVPLPQARRIVRAASQQAQQQRLSPTLVLAVVARESSFRPDALSRYGAHGLMQVVPRHHPEKVKGLARAQLLTPEANIAVGTRVLAEYLDQGNGRLDVALVRYSGNARAYPASVRKLWREFEGVRRSAKVET